MDPSIDLSEVVRHIPENFTGADFSALSSETYMIAVKQRIEELEQQIYDTKKGYHEHFAVIYKIERMRILQLQLHLIDVCLAIMSRIKFKGIILMFDVQE